MEGESGPPRGGDAAIAPFGAENRTVSDAAISVTPAEGVLLYPGPCPSGPSLFGRGAALGRPLSSARTFELRGDLPLKSRGVCLGVELRGVDRAGFFLRAFRFLGHWRSSQ